MRRGSWRGDDSGFHTHGTSAWMQNQRVRRKDRPLLASSQQGSMGTSWEICGFYPGFKWLSSQGTCGDSLATRSNWEAHEIILQSLRLARHISNPWDITGNLPPRASGQLNKAPAVTQRSSQGQGRCQWRCDHSDEESRLELGTRPGGSCPRSHLQ